LANVIEQSFRAPAQDVLLNAHDGYEADDRRQDCDAGNPNQSTPTYTGGHASLDTGMGEFVPMNLRSAWEFREIFDQL
jgi:hypothetical protein